jgi:hypothetical protein
METLHWSKQSISHHHPNTHACRVCIGRNSFYSARNEQVAKYITWTQDTLAGSEKVSLEYILRFAERRCPYRKGKHVRRRRRNAVVRQIWSCFQVYSLQCFEGRKELEKIVRWHTENGRNDAKWKEMAAVEWRVAVTLWENSGIRDWLYSCTTRCVLSGAKSICCWE